MTVDPWNIKPPMRRLESFFCIQGLSMTLVLIDTTDDGLKGTFQAWQASRKGFDRALSVGKKTLNNPGLSGECKPKGKKVFDYSMSHELLSSSKQRSCVHMVIWSSAKVCLWISPLFRFPPWEYRRGWTRRWNNVCFLHRYIICWLYLSYSYSI